LTALFGVVFAELLGDVKFEEDVMPLALLLELLALLTLLLAFETWLDEIPAEVELAELFCVSTPGHGMTPSIAAIALRLLAESSNRGVHWSARTYESAAEVWFKKKRPVKPTVALEEQYEL